MGIVSDKQKKGSQRNPNIGYAFEDEAQKNRLLDSRISYITFCTEPLEGELSRINNLGAFDVPRQLFPYFINGKYFKHASLILTSEENSNILLEYGPYIGQDDDIYNGKTMHYYTKEEFIFEIKLEDGSIMRRAISNTPNGMRFIEVDANIIIDHYHLNDGERYNKGYIFMELKPLSRNNPYTLREIIDECWRNESWGYKDYDKFNHNCQHFVAKVIKITKAKRIGIGTRKSHNISLCWIPPKILSEFENNEKEIQATIGKIPIAGALVDLIHRHVFKDMHDENEESETED